MTTTEPRNGQRRIEWDDYEHFRAYGWNHDRIADRLGVTPASLTTALHRRAARNRNAAQTGAAA